MAELTEAEKKFREKWGGVLDLGTAPEEEEEEPQEGSSSDPALEALLARNPDIDLGKNVAATVGDDVAPVGGRLAEDKSEEMMAAREGQRDGFSAGDLYGDRPEQGLLGTVGAKLQDTLDTYGGEETPGGFQADRDRIRAEQEAWLQEAMETYESVGFVRDGQRYHKKAIPDEEAPNGYRYETILIPHPEDNAFLRMVEQAGRNLGQELGGLFTEGAIARESELSRNVPDYELDGASDFGADALALLAPTVMANKLLKGAAAGTKFVKNAIRGTQVSRAGTAAAQSGFMANVLGTSVAEAVMMNGDGTLAIQPEALRGLTKNALSQEAAEDMAAIFDGMLINGALDGVIGLAARAGGFVRKKSESAMGLFNREGMRRAVTEGTALDVVNVLDPGVLDLPKPEMVRRLEAMSRILNTEKILTVEIGETTKEVSADTATAIMNGAEAYIRETRQNRLNELGEEAFEAMVKEEAAGMSARMLTLLKTQEGTPGVQATRGRMSNEMGSVFAEEADRLAREGGAANIDDAAARSSRNLAMEQRRWEDRNARDLRDNDRELAAIDAERSTVVQDDPIVRDLLEGIDPGLTYSDEANRQLRRNLIEQDLMPEYMRTLDEVNQAYKDIPNVEIDVPMLRNDLSEAVKALHDIDGSGAEVRRVLREVFDGFEPRTTGSRNDPLAVVGEEKIDVKETVDQVMERIGENVGFQDLYRLKGKLGPVIDRMEPGPAKAKLIEFRNSINGEDGQLGSLLRRAEETGDLDLVEAAEVATRADKLYKGMQSRFYNEETMRGVTEAMEKAAQGRGTKYETGPGRGVPDVIVRGQRDLIPQTLADDTGVLMEGLRNALGDASSPGDIKAALVMPEVNRAARELAKAIEMGDEQTANMIYRSFDSIQADLDRIGAKDVLARVEKARNSVKARETELGDRRLAAETTRKDIEAEMDAASNSVIQELISKYDPGQVTATPKKFFSSLVMREDGANAIKKLRAEASGLSKEERDLLDRTIQAAALERMGTMIFGATPVGLKGGKETTKNAKLGVIENMTEAQAENLQASLREAFGMNSKVAKQVSDTLGSIFEAEVGQRLKFSQSGSDTAARSTAMAEMKDAISTATLVVFGYMNPAAAAARRATAAPMAAAEKAAKETQREVMEAIITNPEDFAKLIDMVKKKEDTGTIAKLQRTIFEGVGDQTMQSLRFNARVDEDDDDSGRLLTFEDDEWDFQDEGWLK